MANTCFGSLKMNNGKDFFAHPTAVIDQGARIGFNTKIWHFSHIMLEAVIGNNCTLGQNVFVANQVEIGNHVKVQNNVSLYEGVICEDEVFIGPSAVFTNVYNPRSAVNRQQEYRKTLIRKGATIGANATIVCGVNIGYYAFIGAGAVVREDVADYALVVGVPARQVGWISEYGERLIFDDQGLAICPGTGVRYRLKNQQVVRIQ